MKEALEIKDLKDMLNKTKKLYANNIAYKIRKKQIEIICNLKY